MTKRCIQCIEVNKVIQLRFISSVATESISLQAAHYIGKKTLHSCQQKKTTNMDELGLARLMTKYYLS